MVQRSKAPSITEVAELAGVSLQTVSNVLNFPDRVRPETQKKVLAAVKSLKYSPNAAARRLKTAQASSIAVRLDSNSISEGDGRGLYSGFIQDEFVYQLTVAAENRGIRVITYTANNPEDELKKINLLCNSHDIDGLILTSTELNDPRIKLLNNKGVPFMTFGRPWGDDKMYSTQRPWIDVDGSFGTSLATQKFWDSGYRNIGYAGWRFDNHKKLDPQNVNEDRFQGWLDTISKLDKSRKYTSGKNFSAKNDESVLGGRRMAAELLEKFPEIEVVVCASDTLALGVLLESGRLRKKPLIVSGFDNSPVSKEFNFSSLDQDLLEVAHSAIKILMGESGNQIRHVDFTKESTKAHVLLRPILISR